jgi:hypothetical protein
MDPRIRIRIQPKMLWIYNTAKKAVYEDIMIYYRINFIEFSTARINSPKEYGSTTDPDRQPCNAAND